MDPVTSRRAHDLPNPESDLAHWTSKIKAIQRKVDADEEAEQKKLEEEIAAARKARVRRSRGMSTGSRVGHLDSPNHDPVDSSSPSTEMPSNYVSPPPVQRQESEQGPLRKLMQTNQVYNPDKVAGASEKVGPTSLASFIGGRASGVRLNKHSPQPNAHDPTQFLQPDLSVPHPVFGKGGIAMPGMVTKKKSFNNDQLGGSEAAEPYRPSSTSTRPISFRNDTIETRSADHLDSFSPSYTTVLPRKQSNPSMKYGPSTPKRDFTPTPRSTPAVAKKYLEQVESASPRRPVSPTKPLDAYRPSSTSTSSPANPTLTKSFTSEIPLNKSAREPSPAKFADTRSFQPSLTPRAPSPVKPADSTPVRPVFSAAKTAPSYLSTAPTTDGVNDATASARAVMNRSADFPSTTSLPKPSTSSPAFSSPEYTNTPAFNSAQYTSPSGSQHTAPQSSGLRKIMDANNVHIPDKPFGTNSSQASSRAHPSLASFIGGRASGPKLNRHAPQPDAHDPTQFVQPDLSAPHPIFGKGGIAMPGMVTKKRDSSPEPNLDETTEPSRNRSSQRFGKRERTQSTPNARPPSMQDSMQVSRDTHTSRHTSRPLSFGYLPSQDSQAATSARSRTTSVGASTSRDNVQQSPTKNAIVTPSLARPVRPEPKVSSFVPQAPVPSPAFQRPPAAKDPTPSLSRLKGRGFVQNMVRVSSQLQSPSPPLRSASPDKNQFSGGRKGSVLERWQPKTPTPVELVDVSPSPSSRYYSNFKSSVPLKQDSSPLDVKPRALKAVASLPSFPKTIPLKAPTPPLPPAKDDGSVNTGPKLGSASTMVIIKPSKSSGDLTSTARSEELGMRNTKDRSSAHVPQNTPIVTTTKPLIHPNQDRYREPLKHKGSSHSMDDVFFTQEDKKRPPEHIADLRLSQSILKDPPFQSWEAENHTEDATPFVNDPDPITSQGNQQGQLDDGKTTELGFPYSDVELRTTFMHNVSATDGDHFSSSPPETETSKTERSPYSSPSKHSRIPSTGKRPTVMEVAHTLSQFVDPETPPNVASALPPVDVIIPPAEEPSYKPRSSIAQIQAEKRRSTYEKYSAIILPPLKEETTPVASPAGTLARSREPITRSVITSAEESTLEREPEMTHKLDALALQTSSLVLPMDEPEQEEKVPEEVYPDPDVEEQSIYDDAHDYLSDPDLDISPLLEDRPDPTPGDDIKVISVEVLSVIGNSATSVNKDPEIFHESEILLVVYRTKSLSSGLAATKVWCWLGRTALLGEREGEKVKEVAKRYGTTAVMVHQLAEQSELITILGGQLAIRQGNRKLWSGENTTMHLVRSLRGNILIDECDLGIGNLCSGFSYCITMLDMIYVWHGYGSKTREKDAALRYALTLGNNIQPIELFEGREEDEMFWMILGYDEYAQADYWQWRPNAGKLEPSVFRINTEESSDPFTYVEFLSMERYFQESVYVINCIWEIFVLVGKAARSQKPRIIRAVAIASKLSRSIAPKRPYPPTVHVLVLPSQIPKDLRLSIRDIDEAWLNDGDIPEHMNLVPYLEAIEHLNQQSWDPAVLKDQDMLPVGVGESA